MMTFCVSEDDVMEKNAIRIAFICASIACSPSVFAVDGQVNFTGEILDKACTVDIGGAALSVDLGKVSKDIFKSGPGSMSTPTRFSIHLKNCPEELTGAKVQFDGTTDATDPTLLKITSATPATGVAIGLMTVDHTPLPIGQLNATTYPIQPAVDNNLEFFAVYQQTAASVVAGSGNGNVNFTVSYE